RSQECLKQAGDVGHGTFRSGNANPRRAFATAARSEWWAVQDSNLRPPACKAIVSNRMQSLQRRLLQPSFERQNSMAGDVLQRIISPSSLPLVFFQFAQRAFCAADTPASSR